MTIHWRTVHLPVATPLEKASSSPSPEPSVPSSSLAKGGTLYPLPPACKLEFYLAWITFYFSKTTTVSVHTNNLSVWIKKWKLKKFIPKVTEASHTDQSSTWAWNTNSILAIKEKPWHFPKCSFSFDMAMLMPDLHIGRDHDRHFFSKQYYKYSIQCFKYNINNLFINILICKCSQIHK